MFTAMAARMKETDFFKSLKTKACLRKWYEIYSKRDKTYKTTNGTMYELQQCMKANYDVPVKAW